MRIAVLIYEGLTALDAIGPYEVLSRLPGAEVTFVATQPGPKRTDNGMLSVVAEAALDDLPDPGIVVAAGGFAARDVKDDPAVQAWVRRAHATSQWTTSVCTGSLILGAAGVLDGLRATTHWLAMDELAALGVEPTSERVVEQGKVITAAGVSSGIDMALTLAARVAGPDVAQAIQLSIEYDPQPPFDAGSPEKAPPAIVELIRTVVTRRMEGPAVQR